jgi:hypothetical protein
VGRRAGRSAAAAVLAVGLVGALGGCGGEGITLPSERPSFSLPTGGGTGEPTAPATTVVPPEPTTEVPTQEPTLTPEPPETTAPSTPTPTVQPTATVQPTPTVQPTATVEPTPEPTTEPSTAPSPSGEAAPDAAEDPDDGLSPWWWVLLALVVLAAVTAAVLARSARRRREEQELLAGLESRGRWAVDHGAGALIGAADPAATQEAWSRLNATLVDMAGEVRTLAQQTPADQGAAVMALRDAVASLQGAAEAHARARLSGDPSPTTAEAVFVARDRVSRALGALRAPTT